MSAILSALSLRYLDGVTWELIQDFTVRSDELGLITVEAGFHTDFNSVPRGFWSVPL